LPPPFSRGGGVHYKDDANSVSILNIIRYNETFSDGGGVSFKGSSSNFLFNRVANNISGGDGGGIAVESSELTKIALNEIVENECDGVGGGIWCSGYIPTPSLIVWNKIKNNIAGDKGGGIGVDNLGASIIILNDIEDNEAEKGGGISCEGYLPFTEIFRKYYYE